MRVLFDITHPAQVHLFGLLMQQLLQEGHQILVTSREKDVTSELLDARGIPHACLSRKRQGLMGMLLELACRDYQMLRLARKFRPHLLVAETGVSTGIVGALLGIPRLVFEEAEHARLQRLLGLPFATRICTGPGYLTNHRRRQYVFRGFRPLVYLDPRRFTPNPQLLRDGGVDPAKPYVLLRLVSWTAAHDRGRHGTDEASLAALVQELSPMARVIISSEKPLPESLEPYRNPLPAENMHDLLAFASLCVIEGGTMAVEAAVLGTPTISYNTYPFGYLQALQKQYDLVRLAQTPQELLAMAQAMLGDSSIREEWRQKRDRALAESEDLLAFMRRMVDETADLTLA